MIFSSLSHHTVTMMETNNTTTTTTTVLLDSKTSLMPAPQLGVAKNGYSSITGSVTKEEIAEYWIQKKTEEEEHLLAAIKAAAPEEDYKKFEESVDDECNNDKKDEEDIVDTHNKEDGDCKEIRVGMKDWWTKSKYAYLNQPALESMEKPKRTSSTYTPISFAFYKPPPTRFSSFQVY